MDFANYNSSVGAWSGFINDYPISGKHTGDTTQDLVASFLITDRQGNPRDTLTNFWAGWGVRSRALKQYNRWLALIGPELMRLRWRDAYSIHAQKPILHRTSVQMGCEPDSLDSWTEIRDTTTPRPLPSTEIITSVVARSRWGQRDQDSSTYVELGFFDAQPGQYREDTADPWTPEAMLDTNHVFVVNRRVFEPTDDIPAGARRDSMTALAGTRTIELKLNLMNKGEFVFCRVREVAADTSRLPGASAPRAALIRSFPPTAWSS